MNDPSLRQLRYLVSLADALHFGEAAAKSGVSQPNLSTQIRELERTLGARLVERSSRHVFLTPIGEQTTARARRVLTEVDDLIALAQHHDPFSGRLRLGVIPTVAPYVLPRVLPVVRATYPHLELYLVEDFTFRLVDALINGDLDIAFIALPIEEPGLTSFALAEEPFVLATPRGHPLSNAPSVQTSSIDPEELLLLQEGHCLRDQALEFCDLSKTAHHGSVEGTSLTTLVQMVANGLGITLLPLLATAVDVGSTTEVVTREFTPNAPGRTLGLVWRTSSSRTEVFLALAALLEQQVKQLVQQAEQSHRRQTSATEVAAMAERRTL